LRAISPRHQAGSVHAGRHQLPAVADHAVPAGL